MNATERVEERGIRWSVGDLVTIPNYPTVILHTLEDGEYVIHDALTLDVYDVAENRETAESMANEIEGSEGAGWIAIHVTQDGQEVMQYWRDIVSDCWDLPN